MIARVVGVLSASHRRSIASAVVGGPSADRTAAERMCRRWRWIWRACGGTVAAVTLAATVPYLVSHSQFRSAHAQGLVPAAWTSYSGLYRALPQLLSWLLLALAICVLLSISRAGRAAVGSRPALDSGTGQGARRRACRDLPGGRAAARDPGHDADLVQRVHVLLQPLGRY